MSYHAPADQRESLASTHRLDLTHRTRPWSIHVGWRSAICLRYPTHWRQALPNTASYRDTYAVSTHASDVLASTSTPSYPSTEPIAVFASDVCRSQGEA